MNDREQILMRLSFLEDAESEIQEQLKEVRTEISEIRELVNKDESFRSTNSGEVSSGRKLFFRFDPAAMCSVDEDIVKHATTILREERDSMTLGDIYYRLNAAGMCLDAVYNPMRMLTDIFDKSPEINRVVNRRGGSYWGLAEWGYTHG